MAGFFPFRGIRYNAEGGHVDDVVAPPYDVISASDREALVRRSEHNAVRLELPVEEDGRDRYEVAASLWRRWQAERLLVADDEPSFYAYRMGFHDEAGRPRQTSGIIGALRLEPPGRGVLAHEHTTSKDKADRLNVIRATRANLSPIWTLTTAAGFSDLADAGHAPLGGPPQTRATDEHGVHHRLWALSSPAVLEAISEAVASQPVLIADGHHRYEVGLSYQQEVGPGGGQDFILAFVVELAEEQLSVQAIHRLIDGLGDGFDVLGALEPFFEATPTEPPDETILARMAEAGSLALVLPAGAWLLRPRPETAAAAVHDLDSSRLDVALAAFPPHVLHFQHGWDLVSAPVAKGEADAGVLLRPATVEQIAAIGRGGERMPPKTTFFSPKLATGLVFRSLDL